MTFTPRLTKPEAGNKYYITKAKGGWSTAIVGNPTDPDCNVLHNCNEIDGAFGKITLGGLLAFQFENGLEVDGLCGPVTKKALGM